VDTVDAELEDELSATTEDHVAELVGKAARVSVYIESLSQAWEGNSTKWG
jgi:hypothetical protein